MANRRIVPRTARALAAFTLLPCMLGAAIQSGWAESVSGPIGFAQLPNPPLDVRPKVRTRPDVKNLEALAAAGFGAAEIGIDFPAGPAVARKELHALLETARRVGIRVDLAPGGSQPYVSEGISEADSMQQLVTSHLDLHGGLDYAAAVRQPDTLAGHATLVAVTAARVATETQPAGDATEGASDAAPIAGHATSPIFLDPRSAIDLTPQLDAAGVLHWRVPDGEWVLFSFWQRATGQVMGGNPFQAPAMWSNRIPQRGPGQYYTADIFSGKGLSAALGYLDDNILPGNARALAGSDFGYDSLEVQAEMFWTGDLPRQFVSRRGYSLIPYLPALYTPKESSFNPLDPTWGGALPARPFDFTGDAGERLRYDYHLTLTDLYSERHLGTLTAWAHSRGLNSRVQVAYNYGALDVLRSARAVDIPENESFDPGWSKPFDSTLPPYGSARWRHVLDSYRLTGSGVHLAGGRRATIEFGDDFAIYRKQPIDYAQQLNESLAGGITQGLLTDFTSTDAAWPLPQGAAAMGLGESWTSAWPQWRDWRVLARYFARSTQVLESGDARVDVTVYHDRGLATVHDDAPLFASDALESAGYTYDFIDPQALASANAGAVAGSILGHGVGYRALILDRQRNMPAAAARAIADLARRGLRVVVIGAPPAKSTGFKDGAIQDRKVAASMTRLAALPTVAFVEHEDDVPAALRRLGCEPMASFGDRSPLLTVKRHAAEQDVWWIFNPTDRPVSATGSFDALGAPFALDLWSGASSRVAQWTADHGRTRVPLRLMPHATMALAFRRGEPAPLHLLASSADLVFQDAADLLIGDSRRGRQQYSLSNGRSGEVDLNALPESVELARWHLQVDELRPDGTQSHDLGMMPLSDWRSIPALHDAVGQATYRLTLPLTPQWFGVDRDALLAVGDVAGAMQLSVNGHVVTEQSTGFGQWLVAAWLKPGENLVEIRLDTTLLNRMAALRTAGDPRFQTGPTPLPTAQSGILGPITLSSVARVPLHAIR